MSQTVTLRDGEEFHRRVKVLIQQILPPSAGCAGAWHFLQLTSAVDPEVVRGS